MFSSLCISDAPFLSASSIKKLDSYLVNYHSFSVLQLMECAGLSVARFIINRFDLNTHSILFILGKGMNAGDGLVAAFHLINWGVPVKILFLCSINDLSKDTLKQYHRISKSCPDIFFFSNNKAYFQLILSADIIVDGLLGISISSSPRFPFHEVIDFINSHNKHVVSIDLPSGLNPDSGIPYMSCIQANYTVSLAVLKLGFKALSSHKVLGDLFLTDIGIPYNDIDFLDTPFSFQGNLFYEILI